MDVVCYEALCCILAMLTALMLCTYITCVLGGNSVLKALLTMSLRDI